MFCLLLRIDGKKCIQSQEKTELFHLYDRKHGRNVGRLEGELAMPKKVGGFRGQLEKAVCVNSYETEKCGKLG